MKIRNITLSGGSELPVLFRSDPYQPAFVSFIYSVLYLKNKAVSTGFNSLHLLKSLYERAAADCYDLDELVINKKLREVIRYVDDLVLSFDSEKEISPGTRNSYLNDLLNFLQW